MYTPAVGETFDPAPSFLDLCISKAKVIFLKPDAFHLAYGVQVKCPCCKSAEHVKHKGWNGMRRVCGLNNTCFLMAFEYTCNCGKSAVL